LPPNRNSYRPHGHNSQSHIHNSYNHYDYSLGGYTPIPHIAREPLAKTAIALGVSGRSPRATDAIYAAYSHKRHSHSVPAHRAKAIHTMAQGTTEGILSF